MPLTSSSPADTVAAAARQAIEAEIPGAQVQVTPNSPGHFQIQVVSPVFAGKSMVQQQQLVYRAIAPLMQGDGAPIHAVDSLRTRTE